MAPMSPASLTGTLAPRSMSLSSAHCGRIITARARRLLPHDVGWRRCCILYSIKANNTLAIRAILSDEGAGGDCFGLGELHATLAGGADPGLLVMNGSNKTREEIEAAVATPASPSTSTASTRSSFIADACRDGRRARVNLRLKVLPRRPRRLHERTAPDAGRLRGRREAGSSGGHTVGAAIPLVKRLLGMPGIELLGYSSHIGHLSSRTEAFAAVAGAVAAAVSELHALTGFAPSVLDIGGAWAPERDPSFRPRRKLTDAPIRTGGASGLHDFALRAGLPPGMALPEGCGSSPGATDRIQRRSAASARRSDD